MTTRTPISEFLNQAYVRSLVTYSPDGTLWWKPRSAEMFDAGSAQFGDKDVRQSYADRWNAKYAWGEAFSVPNSRYGYKGGYCKDQHGVKRFFKRAIVVLAYHGQLVGKGFVTDHINGVRDDDRLENLRIVTQLENTRNTAKSVVNTSGVVGVHWSSSREKWVAQISVGNTTQPLGRFDSFDAACAARVAAEKRLGFHDNHGRQPAIIPRTGELGETAGKAVLPAHLTGEQHE